MSETCKICKWWKDECAWGGPRRTDLGICDHPLLNDRNGEVNSLRYQYDEGGRVETGHDFGCIHHQAQEQTP